jgi:hypothetical protein
MPSTQNMTLPRPVRPVVGLIATLAFTFLLLVTFLIGRVVPIDPVLAAVGDHDPQDRRSNVLPASNAPPLTPQRADPAKPRPPSASHSSNFSVSSTWWVAHQAASVCKALAMFSLKVGRSALVWSAIIGSDDSLAGP